VGRPQTSWMVRVRTPKSHAIERARERYGVQLTPEALGILRRQIEDQTALLTKKLPDGIEQWLVMHDGTAMVAVYDPQSRWICSVVPPRDTRLQYKDKSRIRGLPVRRRSNGARVEF